MKTDGGSLVGGRGSTGGQRKYRQAEEVQAGRGSTGEKKESRQFKVKRGRRSPRSDLVSNKLNKGRTNKQNSKEKVAMVPAITPIFPLVKFYICLHDK